ncbi:hypothetical protein D3C85_1897560 [compost metagenome]
MPPVNEVFGSHVAALMGVAQHFVAIEVKAGITGIIHHRNANFLELIEVRKI